MTQTPIPNIPDLPPQLSELTRNAQVYDSSCSNLARVYYIDSGAGLYLKTAPRGTLERQAQMTRFFASRGLSSQVLDYLQLECDWLLTEAVRGDDCIAERYLSDPARLCDTIAEVMVQLHSLPTDGCPDQNRTEEYLRSVQQGYEQGKFYTRDLAGTGIIAPQQAYRLVMDNRGLFEQNCLIHGDFCLPNIMLDGWRFSGFIDLDHAGVGDRHIDIYWALWSLKFNLRTDIYAERFMQAYGKDRIDPRMLHIITAAEAFG